MLRQRCAWIVLSEAFTVVLATGCGGSTSAPPDNTSTGSGFTLTSTSLSLTVAQGGSAATFVKAVRTGGLTGTITWSVTGAPPGLTVTLSTTATADSERVDVAAAGNFASGSYPIIVHATATGATARNFAITIVVSAPTGIVFQSIYVGDHHACGLTATGVAYCWGRSDAGQNGTGNTAQDLTPKLVQGGRTFATLSLPAFGSRACGLTTAGAAYCWGDNFNGEIGDGTTAIRLVPTAAAGGNTFSSIASGNHHTCALTALGSTFCWGGNQYGALGDGGTQSRLSPAGSATGKTWKSIVTGLDHTCALTTTGEPWCWGFGLHGEVGNSLSATSVLVPVAVSGGLTFTTLVAGWEFNCGLTSNNQAWCWGYNDAGSLGDGTIIERNRPVAVAGGLSFTRITAGAFHACALTAAGVAYCWGYNASGALGDGTFTDHTSPYPVSGGLTFKSIAAGNGSTCALTANNVAYCWGSNIAGELGDNTLTYKLVPTAVRVP